MEPAGRAFAGRGSEDMASAGTDPANMAPGDMVIADMAPAVAAPADIAVPAELASAAPAVQGRRLEAEAAAG